MDKQKVRAGRARFSSDAGQSRVRGSWQNISEGKFWRALGNSEGSEQRALCSGLHSVKAHLEAG